MSKTITTTRETTWDVSSAATFTDTFTLSNLGPLTTTFTPAADCLTTWYAMSNHLELGVPSRTDCFPPGFTPGGFSTSRYFSPGLCPSLYTGAKSLDLWWTASGNSGVHCCPIGYTLPAAITGSCFTRHFTTIVTVVTDGTLVRTAEFSEIWAPAIPVMWANADGSQAATTTDPSPGGSGSLILPAASNTSTHSSETTDTTPSNTNHTTIIALATAIPIVLIALCIAVFVFVRRRRATQITDAPISFLPELEGNPDDVHKPGAPYWPAPTELPAIPGAIELPTVSARPVELPAPPAVEQPPTPSAEVITAVVAPPALVPTTPSADVITAAPIAALQDDQEMEWLNRELERVEERRENLRKMEALNEERSELQRRINARLGGGRAAM